MGWEGVLARIVARIRCGVEGYVPRALQAPVTLRAVVGVGSCIPVVGLAVGIHRCGIPVSSVVIKAAV